MTEDEIMENEMTEDEIEEDKILKMPAGREMDLMVAEKIMGWILHPNKTHFGIPIPKGDLFENAERYEWRQVGRFEPSIDMNSAWEVIKEMSAKNYWCYMSVLSSLSQTVFKLHGTEYVGEAGVYELPLAICRGALIAILLPY